jgi:hypothetical protein
MDRNLFFGFENTHELLISLSIGLVKYIHASIVIFCNGIPILLTSTLTVIEINVNLSCVGAHLCQRCGSLTAEFGIGGPWATLHAI